MRIINVISQTDAYILIRDLNLKPRTAGTIDVDTLLLSELKSLRNLYLANDIIISESDFNYIVAKIEQLSGGSGGGDAPVKSVNTEIGDVVLDASKIKVTEGHSIEEEFGQLASVAYSGNYLDLSNRPTGTGEPFTVIDWDPYNEDSVDIQPVAANSSTSYSNGTMSAVTPPSLVAELKDIGYPQSPEIILTQGSNGSPLNLNITPSSTGISKVFTIEDFSSLNIQPLDVFPYDGNPHGAYFQFIIIQLEENETMSSLTVQDMGDKGLGISLDISNLYQNESNGYTEAQVTITANGASVLDVPVAPYGNYNNLNLNIVNNQLFIGVDGYKINLIDYGFDANKRFGALVFVRAYANSFDVATPFNIALSAVSSPPVLNCEIPRILDISVHKDEKLVFIFSDVPVSGNPTNIMQLIVAESSGYLAYWSQVDGGAGTGIVMISSEYVDSNGYINYKFNGTEFSLKNNNTLDYDTIATYPSNVLNYFTIQETDSLLDEPISKTSWSFTINSMQKSSLVDGKIPSNAVDGSTLRVTNDGLFDNVELKTGDIVTPYSNKTKLLLHRITQPTPPTIISSDVTTAGTNAVSGDAITSFVNSNSLEVVDSTLGVKVAPFSNYLQSTVNGLFVPIPDPIPTPETIAFNLQSSTTEVVNGTRLSVKRSTDSGNSLEFRSNGVYVPTPPLDNWLSSYETGKAPSSYTVYNAFNSNTLRMSGSRGEVKLSVSAGNRLVDSGSGLYVGPEPTAPIATVIDQSVSSAVSSSTVYSALTSDTISFTNPKANVKIENPATSSVQINTSVNGISAVLKNTVKLGSVRETVSYSVGNGYRSLSLTNFNVFVIDCSGSSGTVALNGLNDLDGDQAKTITIIVKNTTALTWAAEFAWVDNVPPTLQPSTTLVVTGVYASNASNATYTAGKILCTFSYFTI